MSYINITTSIFRNRKFKQFKRYLAKNHIEAVGYLISLWTNVLDLAEDGDITKWTDEDIAEYTGWQGEPKIMLEALTLKDASFIDIFDDGRKLIHDWWEYAGRYLSTKYRTNYSDKLKYIKGLYDKKDSFGQSLDIPKTDFSATDKIDKIDKINKQRIDVVLNAYISLKGWNRQTYKDYGRDTKTIKELLLKANDDNIVLEALNWMAQQKYSWTLETLCYKKWPDFMAKDKKPALTDWTRICGNCKYKKEIVPGRNGWVCPETDKVVSYNDMGCKKFEKEVKQAK